MLTGWPPATGSAALAAIHAVSEQPPDERRLEKRMDMDHLHALFASHSSRLHPSLCVFIYPRQRPRQRPREAMPFRLAENRSTLDTGYSCSFVAYRCIR
eukprot:1657744-Prymnesium_polylepis.1